MTTSERRKIFCSVTFHVIAITCVVWSLYVLIDRTAEEIKQGNDNGKSTSLSLFFSPLGFSDHTRGGWGNYFPIGSSCVIYQQKQVPAIKSSPIML